MMPRRVAFTVPGRPSVWARARGANRHTAPAMRERQSAIRDAAMRAGCLPPMDGPVRLTVEAVFLTGQRALEGRPHLSTPDADNLGKQVADALSSCAYRDDRQIAELIVRKTWGREPRTEIVIEEIPAT